MPISWSERQADIVFGKRGLGGPAVDEAVELGFLDALAESAVLVGRRSFGEEADRIEPEWPACSASIPLFESRNVEFSRPFTTTGRRRSAVHSAIDELRVSGDVANCYIV